MRVTQQMMARQVVHNFSLSIERLLVLQSRMSSGRRIQKPSDDPMGVTRSLSYRSQLSDIEQFKRNISWGQSWLGMVESTLGSAGDFIHRAQEIATSLVNDTYDANARHAAAREIESIFEQLLAAANAKIENRYIFSGHKTQTIAFRASSTGVVYQGDQGRTRIEIASASMIEINQVGSELAIDPLYTLGAGEDLNPGVTRNRLLTELNNSNGVDLGPPANGQFTITDNNTGVAVTVDISGATDVGDVIDAINAAVPANLTAEVSPVGNALRLTPTATGVITLQTPLANLNNGAGMELNPGTFHVTDNAGTVDITIDLSGTTTVGELITAFNTQIAAGGVANVTMAINPGGTGLRITDANGAPLGLVIENFNNQSTAHDLGLVGAVNAQMDGQDLNPQPDFSVSEAGGSVAAELGLLGSFHTPHDGTDLNPILTLDTPVADLNDTLGLSLGRVRIAQGDQYTSVDLSAAVTVGDVITALNNSGMLIVASLNDQSTGIKIEPTVNDRTLMITDEDATKSARALGIFGSPDIFGNFMLLIEALDNDDRETVGLMIGAMETAANRVLDQRASIGAKVIRLQTTDERLSELDLSITRLLSEIEDADILAVTTDLANQQNVYQAALNATARILLPSLVDFMR